MREDAPALGAESHALRDDLVGRKACNVLVLVDDLAFLRLDEACNRVHSRRLAGAVGTDQGDNLAFVDLEGDSFHGVDCAVVDLEVINLQHGHFSTASLAALAPCLPRYASMTRGSDCTSSGVPLQMILP